MTKKNPEKGRYFFDGRDLKLSCGCYWKFEDNGDQEYDFCEYHDKLTMREMDGRLEEMRNQELTEFDELVGELESDMRRLKIPVYKKQFELLKGILELLNGRGKAFNKVEIKRILTKETNLKPSFYSMDAALHILHKTEMIKVVKDHPKWPYYQLWGYESLNA